MNSNRAGRPWASAWPTLGGGVEPTPAPLGGESPSVGWRAKAGEPAEVASRPDGRGTVAGERRLAQARHPSSLTSVAATMAYFGSFPTVRAAHPAPDPARAPEPSPRSAASAVVATALTVATRAESDEAADLVSAAARAAVDVEHAFGLIAELEAGFASLDVTNAASLAADTTARAAAAARTVRATAAAHAADEIAKTAAATAVAVRRQADAFAMKVAAAAEATRITTSAGSTGAGAAEAASSLATAVATAAAVHAESTALAAALVAGAVAAAAARVAYTDAVTDDALEGEVRAAAEKVQAIAEDTARRLATLTTTRAADAALAARQAADIVATGRMASGQSVGGSAARDDVYTA